MLTLREHESHIHGLPFPSFRAWIFASLFNSTFSFYWDIEQDWDMPWLAAIAARGPGARGTSSTPPLSPQPASASAPIGLPSRHSTLLSAPLLTAPSGATVGLPSRWRWMLPSLRPTVAFAPSWYIWLVVCNLVLRLSWTHRLIGDLEAMNAVALAIAMLEVFRSARY